MLFLSESLLFKVFLGRLPKSQAVKELSKYSWLKIVQILLASEEYKSLATKERREKLSLASDEIDTIAGYIGLERNDDLQKGNCQWLIEKWILPHYLQFTLENKVQFIQSKSLPRSGHHFLISMLTRYFQREAHYCEAHSPQGCCRVNPCIRPFNQDKSNKYMIQKSHDFQLADDKSLSSIYIIQHRAPMTRIQSNFELALKSENAQVKDTAESFREFAINDAKYSVKFYNKWYSPTDGLKKIFVLYDELVENTEAEVSRIVEEITGKPVDAVRLKYAIENKNQKVNTHNSPEGIRSSDNHRYYDKDFYKQVEEIIASGIKWDIKIPYEFI